MVLVPSLHSVKYSMLSSPFHVFFANYLIFACVAMVDKYKSVSKGIIFITYGALSKYDKCTYLRQFPANVKFGFHKDFQNNPYIHLSLMQFL
jgi:hypothetical protein